MDGFLPNLDGAKEEGPNQGVVMNVAYHREVTNAWISTKFGGNGRGDAFLGDYMFACVIVILF